MMANGTFLTSQCCPQARLGNADSPRVALEKGHNVAKIVQICGTMCSLCDSKDSSFLLEWRACARAMTTLEAVVGPQGHVNEVDEAEEDRSLSDIGTEVEHRFASPACLSWLVWVSWSNRCKTGTRNFIGQFGE